MERDGIWAGYGARGLDWGHLFKVSNGNEICKIPSTATLIGIFQCPVTRDPNACNAMNAMKCQALLLKQPHVPNTNTAQSYQDRAH